MGTSVSNTGFADCDSDFVLTFGEDGTLVVPAGQLTSTPTTITAIDEGIDEVDETVIVEISSVSNGLVDPAEGVEFFRVAVAQVPECGEYALLVNRVECEQRYAQSTDQQPGAVDGV